MMKKWITKSLLSAVVLAFLVISGLNVSAAGKSGFKVGTAKVKITPTVPIPMSGYGGRNDPFKGVHDDLYCRAIVFSDGNQ